MFEKTLVHEFHIFYISILNGFFSLCENSCEFWKRSAVRSSYLFFLCLIPSLLFHAPVLGKRLAHVFHISSSHAEWHLLWPNLRLQETIKLNKHYIPPRVIFVTFRSFTLLFLLLLKTTASISEKRNCIIVMLLL